MPSVEHEPNRPPVDHDIEKRIRNFGTLIIAALRNFTILIIIVGMLWFSIESVPSFVRMPVLLRWACIVFVFYNIIVENAWVLRAISSVAEILMSKIVDEKQPWTQDLEKRTTDFEDWVLANFCVLVGLSTIGFVAWYWITVIALTARTFFCWICTMGGLFSLFWPLKQTIRFYWKFKGVKHEEAWGLLLGVNVLRFYNQFEWLKAEGLRGRLLDACRAPFELLKFFLDIIGLHIGRGPLFDRLPDEWKAARRACKTVDEVISFYGGFAGASHEESDENEDDQDRKDTEEPYFPPSVFEWEPNPVILPHLRGEYLQSPTSGPSTATDTPDHHVMDTVGAVGRFRPVTAVDYDDDEDIAENNQASPSAPRPTGPATMSINLSSFACPQCAHVAKKKFELNKHVTQTHNHRFKCIHDGCGKPFGLRANFERHEAINTGRQGFKCSNSWCKIPGQIFTREDNLKRHMKQCIAPR